jgi:hypothetical protein
LGAYLRRGEDRRAGTAEVGGGDRGEDYSGELAVKPRQQASVKAPTGPREGSSSFGWQRRGPEEGARRAG